MNPSETTGQPGFSIRSVCLSSSYDTHARAHATGFLFGLSIVVHDADRCAPPGRCAAHGAPAFARCTSRKSSATSGAQSSSRRSTRRCCCLSFQSAAFGGCPSVALRCTRLAAQRSSRRRPVLPVADTAASPVPVQMWQGTHRGKTCHTSAIVPSHCTRCASLQQRSSNRFTALRIATPASEWTRTGTRACVVPHPGKLNSRVRIPR